MIVGNLALNRATSRPTWRALGFDPNFVTGLVFRLDASHVGTVTQDAVAHASGGQLVNAWLDTIGGNSAVATGDNRPRYTTSSNRPAVCFERAAVDTLSDTLADATPSAAIKTLPVTIFVVCTRTRDAAQFDRIFRIGTGADLNLGLTMTGISGSDPLRWVVGGSGSNTAMLMGNSVANGNVSCVVANASGCSTFLDGVAGQTSTRVADFGGSTELRLAREPGGVSFRGCIFEVLVYGADLSAANRQKVEGHLAHKWRMTANLAADHPYKVDPPLA